MPTNDFTSKLLEMEDILVNDVLVGHGEVVITENDTIGISITNTKP